MKYLIRHKCTFSICRPIGPDATIKILSILTKAKDLLNLSCYSIIRWNNVDMRALYDIIHLVHTQYKTLISWTVCRLAEITGQILI